MCMYMHACSCILICIHLRYTQQTQRPYWARVCMHVHACMHAHAYRDTSAQRLHRYTLIPLHIMNLHHTHTEGHRYGMCRSTHACTCIHTHRYGMCRSMHACTYIHTHRYSMCRSTHACTYIHTHLRYCIPQAQQLLLGVRNAHSNLHLERGNHINCASRVLQYMYVCMYVCMSLQCMSECIYLCMCMHAHIHACSLR